MAGWALSTLLLLSCLFVLVVNVQTKSKHEHGTCQESYGENVQVYALSTRIAIAKQSIAAIVACAVRTSLRQPPFFRAYGAHYQLNIGGRTAVRPYNLRNCLPGFLCLHLLHFHRAELELRNLAVRIEDIVCQQIGGSLAEVEGDEHAAFLRAYADPRSQDDGATSGTDSHEISVLHAQRIHIFRMDLDKRFGLDRIQGFGAASHGAGMPMLQHPAGVQHEGKLRVRQFFGRRKFCRYELASALGEILHEEHGLTWLILLKTRVKLTSCA